MATQKPTRIIGGQGATAFTGGKYGMQAAKSGQPVAKKPQKPTRIIGGQGATAFTGGAYGMQAAKSGQPVSRPRTAEGASVPVKRDVKPKPKTAPVQVVKTAVAEKLSPVKQAAKAKSPTAFQMMNARAKDRNEVYSGTKTASGLNARPGFKTVKDIFRKKGK